jgi:hypothetical protein
MLRSHPNGINAIACAMLYATWAVRGQFSSNDACAVNKEVSEEGRALEHILDTRSHTLLDTSDSLQPIEPSFRLRQPFQLESIQASHQRLYDVELHL